MSQKNARAYYDEAYPPLPTEATKFWRKSFIWQLVRFAVLNLKMMRIVVLGHS
jgi:hypothetical protein